MVTQNDLPKSSGAVVFELDDGAVLTVEKRAHTYYGRADSFDVEENVEMFVTKLNAWGAKVIGWE